MAVHALILALVVCRTFHNVASGLMFFASKAIFCRTSDKRFKSAMIT